MNSRPSVSANPDRECPARKGVQRIYIYQGSSASGFAAVAVVLYLVEIVRLRLSNFGSLNLFCIFASACKVDA